MNTQGIRERRLALGMTLRELSRQAEINPGRLSIIERGVTPSFDEFQRIESRLRRAERLAR